ncbi:MAG: PD-(D/E)XK nuclease family protein [Candidatus Hydrogenedentota bacterium]
MAQVRVLTGLAWSTRREDIDRLLLSDLDTTRLIVPTQRTVQQRTRRILASAEISGLMGHPIVNFAKFAEELLEGTPESRRPVPALTQHLLLRHALERCAKEGALDFLGEVALSAGFLSHVQRVISQLKQSAVDPEAFHARVVQRKNPTPFDSMVARVYKEYQDSLVDSNACDLQGMYWLADRACRDQEPAALESIDTLLIDGFDDFTPSEFRLIQSIAPHLNQLVFGLSCSMLPTASDAYAVPRKTFNAIRDVFDAAHVDCEGEGPDDRSSCDVVSSLLFGRDPESNRPPSEGIDANLTLTHCNTVADEIQTLARDVKRDLVENGINPADVLIVFKHPEAYRETMEAVFAECGIPWHSNQSTTLAQSRFSDFLANLYLATTNWDRDRVLFVLTSPYFKAVGSEDTEHTSAYRNIALQAGIADEGGSWVDMIHRVIERLETDGGRTTQNWLARMPILKEACRALITDVQRLETISESLLGAGTLADHVACFAELAKRFSPETLVALAEDNQRAPDVQAWYGIHGLSYTVSTIVEDDSEKMDRADFVDTLHECFALTPVADRGEREGVLCLSLEDARHLEYPVVYMCGVNEGTVPSAPPRNAIYSPEDQRDLLEAGIPLKSASGHLDMERLQFLRLFSVATQRLTISWHGHNAQGQPMYPSPYVSEVQRLHNAGLLLLSDAANIDSWHASPREAVNAVVLGGLDVPADLASEVSAVRTRSALELTRLSDKPFNEYDGVLNDPELLSELTSFFDHRHTFSAYQIETQIDCPFRYLMNVMLKLPDVDTPSSILDARLAGKILHHALERFYRHYASVAMDDVPLNEILEKMIEIGGEVFDRRARDFRRAYPGIARAEKARLIATLHRHVRIHHDTDDGAWNPTYFETSFGESARDDENSITTPDGFELKLGDVAYRFAGRIDRIDMDDKGHARIVDYKMSLASGMARDMKAGRNVQLALYTMALESLLIPESACEVAQYEHVGRAKTVAITDKNRDSVIEAARESIESSIHAMQQGRFHPTTKDKACSYCPSNKVCRYEEGRIGAKVQS